MKIVIIIPSLTMGGAERVAVSLANWIVKNKNDEVTLINLSKEQKTYEISENIRLYNIGDLVGEKKCNRIKRFLLKKKNIEKILDKEKVDIIYEMLYFPIVYVWPYRLKHKNIVLIGSERNNPNAKGVSITKKVMSRIVPLMCDSYIFQTETIRKMFNKVIQQKSVVIPNSVSNPNIAKIEKNIDKEKIISNMGRLHYQKGQDFLIKAFHIVQKKYPEYKLVIYGEGEEKNHLLKIINDLNLNENVILAGKDSAAIEKIAKTEMFVLSSRYEGMPNALLEAMACGLPCISTNCIAGPSEIIKDNINGLLTDVDDTSKLAEKILYLIENKSIAKKIGDEAKNVLEDYSVDVVFGKYYDFFKTELNKRRK